MAWLGHLRSLGWDTYVLLYFVAVFHILFDFFAFCYCFLILGGFVYIFADIIMSKKNKKQTVVEDFDELLQAVKEVTVNKKILRATACAFNIPRSSLCRYISKLNMDVANSSDDDLINRLKEIAAYKTSKLVIYMN